jgi:SAM-dependent methyltransferase
MAYDVRFFDYVDSGAVQSARILVATLGEVLSPTSVLDIGCGRGAWLMAWKEHGVRTVMGLDGAYVDPEMLYVDPVEFSPVDLSVPFDLGRTFDLVQCLEVGEHIRRDSAADLVLSATKHGNVVMFSAAVPGQGGTQHINEQPLEFWRDLFGARGYVPYDYLRPRLHGDVRVEPWYRWNTVLYANQEGEASLPVAIRASRVAPATRFHDYTSVPWRVRRALVAPLPVAAVDVLAGINARLRGITRKLLGPK